MNLNGPVELLCPMCGRNDWRVAVGPWGPEQARVIVDCRGQVGGGSVQITCRYRMSFLMPADSLDKTGPVELGNKVGH